MFGITVRYRWVQVWLLPRWSADIWKYAAVSQQKYSWAGPASVKANITFSRRCSWNVNEMFLRCSLIIVVILSSVSAAVPQSLCYHQTTQQSVHPTSISHRLFQDLDKSQLMGWRRSKVQPKEADNNRSRGEDLVQEHPQIPSTVLADLHVIIYVSYFGRFCLMRKKTAGRQQPSSHVFVLSRIFFMTLLWLTITAVCLLRSAGLWFCFIKSSKTCSQMSSS